MTPGTTQFGLRQSIRNSSGFGQGLNFMRDNNNSTNGSNNTSMNDSSKGNSPLLSPKINKMDSKEEESRQYLMKKRSPTKMYDEK